VVDGTAAKPPVPLIVASAREMMFFSCDFLAARRLAPESALNRWETVDFGNRACP
jgi:hypothetical protein